MDQTPQLNKDIDFSERIDLDQEKAGFTAVIEDDGSSTNVTYVVKKAEDVALAVSSCLLILDISFQ